MDQIQTAVKTGENPDNILLIAVKALKHSPEKAADILEAIGGVISKSGGGDFFDFLIKLRMDLLEKFLDYISNKKGENQFSHLLARPAHRRNVDVVKGVVDYIAKTDKDLAEDTQRTLMYPALQGAIFNQDTAVFDYLVKNRSISKWQWDTPKGQGNALFLWTMVQEDSPAQNKAIISYLLKHLLNAGVRPETPCTVKLDRRNPKNFQSLMAMVCNRVDNYEIQYRPILNILISHGVSWGKFNEGERDSAKHILKHPTVVAHYRRQALEIIMKDVRVNLDIGGIETDIKKRDRGNRM